MKNFTDYYLRNRDKLAAIFFDVDGTISDDGKPLPGAQELFSLLKKGNFPYLILTNDSCRSCAEKAAHQNRNGLAISAHNIVSSGDALALWAKEHYRGGCFFRNGRFGRPDFAAAAGIETTSDPEKIFSCAGVLGGEGAVDMHANLEAIFNFFLRNPEAPYIVPNPDSYWPGGRFGMGFGAGCHAKLIELLLREAGIKKEIVYLGKPYPSIYEVAMQKLAADYPGRDFSNRKKIVSLGDSLYADIRGGNANGFLSALVLTGITNRAMADAAQGEFRPALVFDRL